VRAIGGITVSKWSKLNPETQQYEEWFNIEDGASRMSACLDFYKGSFITAYGGIDDGSIRCKLERYSVPVIIIDKLQNVHTTNAQYFQECCENFSQLQESKKLSAS
jgi:hypothetical protein